MIGFYAAGAMGESGPPSSGFWDAIAITTPQVWLRLNEASGAVATNSGTGSDGSYNGTVAYQQGSLCSGQAGANSIQTVSSPAGYVRCTTSSGDLTGVIGICYAGTGATSGGAACILWRTIFSNTGSAYLRIDQTSIAIQPSGPTGAINTGVASSVLKDGDPHFIMVGTLAETPTTLRMWIDGGLVWTHSSPETLVLNSDIVIARNGSTNQYALGRYADAFIAENATTAQVAAINSAWAP